MLYSCKPGAAGAASVASPASAPNLQHKVESTPEMLSCLECGVKFKMLKRHLLTVHNVTPEDYRQKHNLSANAPMVTSSYAELRSQLAKSSGLGTWPSRRNSRRDT